MKRRLVTLAAAASLDTTPPDTAPPNLPRESLMFGSVQWIRLLETCYRRDASDLLLAPGSPPMIRLRESWRVLQTSPLDLAAVQDLANDQLGTKPDGQVEGYAYSDFQYQDARFRAMAFGYPDTILLIVSQYPGSGEGNLPRDGQDGE